MMEAVKKLHVHLIVSGLHICQYAMSKVIRSYALQQSDMVFANEVFEQIESPTTFLYNTILRGLAQSDAPKDAIIFYKKAKKKGMEPDNLTFPYVFKACAKTYAHKEGKQKHNHVTKLGFLLDIFVINSQIHLYAACGDLVCAISVFDERLVKDVVSWNSLVSGYWIQPAQLIKVDFTRLGDSSMAVCMVRQMQRAKVKPDAVVIASVLSACAQFGALDLGKWIHDYVGRNDIKTDIIIENSLIDMYTKCGSTQEALEVFREMKEDTLSLKLIILGLANNGFEDDALYIFHSMLAACLRPNDVTFLGLMIACANRQLVQEGLNHFESMK
ncbi:Pentatricopeptide repeat-containing protein [Dichanthelium oligosanthes]|uniref:Pentatricopeptide repeat-containing protein n=1 Tax=Dichanthelium oligosanthes TaxID=888268 RepID=A0A1E5WMP6_9POAL|nr:Pentatricopeptide repeat-containing protein [Dichanthelium oligosanthes]